MNFKLVKTEKTYELRKVFKWRKANFVLNKIIIFYLVYQSVPVS